MAFGNSKIVTTNQTGPHDRLIETVQKHIAKPSQKPFSPHTLDAFAKAKEWLAGWSGDIILDSCCGTGESTAFIAAQYPNAKIIGVDKSIHRLQRHPDNGENYILIQADLNDFWRLAKLSAWQISQHYLLYPNPYPKSVHYKRRWHMSAAFSDIIGLGGTLIVRSNWQLYIQEFCQALAVVGISSECAPYNAEYAMTAFERKYWASKQQSWQLEAKIENKLNKKI